MNEIDTYYCHPTNHKDVEHWTYEHALSWCNYNNYNYDISIDINFILLSHDPWIMLAQ